MTNDTYGEVEQPEFGDGRCFYWSLHALGGCFGLCCYHRGYYLDSRLDIWIMKEYSVKESWIKVVSVPLDDPGYGYEHIDTNSFLVSTDGKILIKFDVCFDTCLMFYNPKRQSQTYPKFDRNKSYSLGLEVYVQSLVLLNDHD